MLTLRAQAANQSQQAWNTQIAHTNCNLRLPSSGDVCTSPDTKQRLCCRYVAPDQRLAERRKPPLVDQVDLAALGTQELDQGEVATSVVGGEGEEGEGPQ